MGEVFDRLKASAGERGLMNALGRWRQRVSQLLDSSGGIVALETTNLALPVTAVVGVVETLVTASTFNTTGATRPQTIQIRCGVSGRLQTGDTSATLTVTLQSRVGIAWLPLRSWTMGIFDLDTQFLSATFEQTIPVTVDTEAQFRLIALATGTATDAIVIDPTDGGFAYISVQISNNPSPP